MDEKIKVNIVEKIEDGKYEGQIIDVKRDNKQYDYMRYTVQLFGMKQTLSFSFPSRVSCAKDGTPVSQHAVFLHTMGVKLMKDDIDNAIGMMYARDVQFLVANKKKGDKTYAEIVKESIKPVQLKL